MTSTEWKSPALRHKEEKPTPSPSDHEISRQIAAEMRSAKPEPERPDAARAMLDWELGGRLSTRPPMTVTTARLNPGISTAAGPFVATRTASATEIFNAGALICTLS
jgi:hypothetical protein